MKLNKKKKVQDKEKLKSWLDMKTCGFLSSSIGLFTSGFIGAVLVGGLGVLVGSKIHGVIDWWYDVSEEEKNKYDFFKCYENKFENFYKKFCNSVGVNFNATIEEQFLKIQEHIEQCYKEYKEDIKNNPDIEMEEKIIEYIEKKYRCFVGFVEDDNFFNRTYVDLCTSFRNLLGFSNGDKNIFVDTTLDLISALEKIDPKRAVGALNCGSFLNEEYQKNAVEVIKKINERKSRTLNVKLVTDSNKDMPKGYEGDRMLYLTEKKFVAMYRYLILKRKKLGQIEEGLSQNSNFNPPSEYLFSKVIKYEGKEKQLEEKYKYWEKELKNYEQELMKKFGPISLPPGERNVDTVYEKVEKRIEEIFGVEPQIEKKARTELQCLKKIDKEIVSSNDLPIKTNSPDRDGLVDFNLEKNLSSAPVLTENELWNTGEEDEELRAINNESLDGKKKDIII